ncbi:hypothetical protein [Rhodomicrobium lacus]|uniref:hypothetical protein n=1 Tax=Rhodomicrobium lacus TaxID=2498452 RepID=UPI0026E3C07D|nr:hypothetical protein [Rhodomicrobium lacus]WKW51319.1 hypothetical protein QMO75_02160 [Rhodomicrobium lacus]
MKRILGIATAIGCLFQQSASIADVGYFSPSGVRAEFALAVDMATINAINGPEHIADSFRIAAENAMKVNLDIGPLISKPRPAKNLIVSYASQDGSRKKKALAGMEMNKLRDFVSDDRIRELLKPYMEAIFPHKTALYSVFLVDEPYLNGVSKSELERVANVVRSAFAENGYPEVKLGVLFAGAMFNKRFSATTQKAALAYVDTIDSYAKSEQARIDALPRSEGEIARAQFEKWKEVIFNFRLTTYDTAGNIYAGGGIPSGFDILAFDLYLSTALLDSAYEDTISVLATESGIPECADFINVKMSKFRSTLSFMQSGPMSAGDHLRDQDHERMNRFYNCRVKATVKLLRDEAKNSGYTNYETMVITESSSNGLMEFASDGSPEAEQPELLVKARVVEEVERAIRLYKEPDSGIDHMLFFTFDDEFDKSIKLQVGGVASNPKAMESISAASDRK